jgi:hypothetical protein
MTQAQLKILETVQLRPHTRSELIRIAVDNGCHSVIRAEFLIDLLTKQRYLHRYAHRVHEGTYMYKPGERCNEEDHRPDVTG